MILSEGIGYVERARWAVMAPASALVLASVLAVSLAATGSGTGAAPLGRLRNPAAAHAATAPDTSESA